MNNFAISSSGIGEALQRSASAMASAGNTLEESIGLITAMNNVVQNPETVGTTLKTVSMYLRAAKTEAESAGESTEGMASSVSKLRQELLDLTGQKVDIMIDENEFKSTYQIMKELSQVWDTLTDVSRANILERIGGKRNANAVAALLTNFKDAESAMKSAMNAFGSATAENEKFLDSINGKMATLKARFEELSALTVGDSLIKGIADLANGALSLATNFQKVHALLPTISAVAVFYKKFSNGKVGGEALSSIMSAINNVQGDTLFAAVSAATGKLTNAQKKFVAIQLEARVKTGELDKALAAQIINVMGLSTALGTADSMTRKFSNGIKGIAASLKSWDTALLVLEVVYAVVSSAIDNYNQKIQESIDKANEIVRSYSDAQSTYRNNQKTLQGLKGEFDKLSVGVDNNGQNVKLTADQYEQYLSIIDQIVSISPGVVSGYDNEGHAIMNYSSALEDAITKQEEYIANERAMYLGSGKELFSGKANEYKEYLRELGQAGKEIKWPIYGGNLWSGYDTNKLSAIKDIFEEMNIKIKSVDHWWQNYDDLMSIYERSGELITRLQNTGLYKPDEIDEVRNAIYGLSGAYTQLKAIEQEEVSYLSTWAQNKDWFIDTPLEATDALVDGFSSVVDATKSYNENLKMAEAYGREFSETMQSEAVTNLRNMAKGLSDGLNDGEEELEAYNAALAEFAEGFENPSAAILAIIAHLNSLSNAYRISSEDTKSTSYQTKGLAAAIDSLSKGYSVLEKAEADMLSGKGLSTDTINAMLALMDEGEKVTDYLNYENGLLTLNREKWEERSRATMSGDIKAMEDRKAYLQEIQDAQNTVDKYGSFTPDFLSPKELANLQAAQEVLRGYDGDLATLSSDILSLSTNIALYQSANKDDDPLNLTALISNLDSTSSSAKTLLSTYDDLRNGTAMTAGEIAALALQDPFVRENMDLFDTTSLEGQIFLIQKALSLYEQQYDAAIDAKIAMLKAEEERAEENGESTDGIIATIQWLEYLKSLTVEDIYGTKKVEETTSAYLKLSDAVGDLTNASSVLEAMTSGKDYMSTFQKIADFVEENDDFSITDFLNADGSIKSVDDALITKVFDTWLEKVKDLDGFTPEFGEKLREEFKLTVEGTEDSTESLEKFSKKLSSFSEAANLVAGMKSGENYISMLQDIVDFVSEHEGTFTLSDFINDDGSFKDVSAEFTDNLFNKLLERITQMEGYSQAMGDMLRKGYDNIIAGEKEVISSSERVSDALSSIENVEGFFQKISSKDSTVIEQINSAIDLADSLKDASGNIPDWTSWINSITGDGAKIEWNTNAIRALSDAQVDNAFASIGLAEKYPQLIEQIKKYNYESNLAAATAERVAESHEKVSSALSVQKDYGGYTQITTDAYQELIDIDQRYAAAIEYQNGVMVLNGQKHEQITQTILSETKALAEAEKRAILTSDEYQNLAKALELGQLDRDGMQRLLDLNVQIQGYETLANEIDNASSAYARWVNRRGDDGMDRYSQAMEAFELLNATLNDQESEYFGRIGREEFTQAVDFVIGENVELNTPEFERGIALAQRYLTEGAEGAINFYDDLVKNGLLDATTGAMDTTIAEISTKLGVSEELVRTMIDRVNEYQNESAKIKVKEPEVSEASEAESQIAQLIKSLEDAQTYATTLSETPIDIQITDGENKKELLNSMSTALDTIKSCIQSIISSPLSFNMDDLSLAVETVKGYITKTQEALGETDDLSIDVNTNDSEDKLSALQGNAQLVKEAFDGIVVTLQAVMSGVNTVNSNELEIKPGRTPQLLGEVSSQLSNIITKLQQIAKNSKITIKINEVTTSSKSSSSGSAISKLGSWLGSVFGRANAGGTMKSPGGKTLVGELGMETVVDPHTNQWYTVGERGAEFVTLPKDAIVFNHKQTEELFGTGRIDSRGDAMASGNGAASLLSGLVSSAKNFVSKALGKTTAAIQQAAGVAASTAAGAAVSALAKPLSDSVASLGTRMPGGTSKNQSSSGNGGGSGGNSSAEEEESILEKLKKKYEELDEAIQHLIRHQEFLYFQSEKGLDYTGMEDSLTEQVRLYREIMENASNAVKEMIANGAADTDKELQEMEEKYWQAYEKVYDILGQINTMYVDALNDKIDKIQNAYDNLSKAAEEFNESGGITVDSFQALIANGVQYLSFLDNVNGQYVINEEAIQKMIAAEKEQLAIEQALSYIKQLQQALTDGDINLVEHLVDLNNQLSDSTWNVVYAQAAMLKAAGLSDEQYEQVLSNINALQALSNQVTTQNIDKIEETADKEDNLNDDRLDALDKILDLTEDLIKKETEDQVDAIEDQIDAYKKLIDLKKESLQASKEENEYSKNVAEKTKNIADLQAKISQLSLDDSREAQAQRAALMEELEEAQSDLADAQSDHSYDLQSDALDKMAEEYEQGRQQEIDDLENSISSTEKLYQLAIQRISTQWDTLYEDLIAWNYESGSTLQSEIVAAWKQAQAAVLQYGSYVEAVAKLKAEMEDDDSDDGSPNDSPSTPTVVATGSPYTPTPTTSNPSKPPANPVLPPAPSTNELQAEVVEQPVQAVEVSNGRWHVRADASAKSASLGVVGNGTKLEYTGQETGEWYSVIYNGQQAWINKGCGGLKKYHTGGIVGGKEESNDKEVMALLEKGELVLDEPKKDALYEYC